MSRHAYLPVLVLVVFFVLATYIAQIHNDYFVSLIGTKNTLGFLSYIGLMILATVVAPLSTLPMMPIAVSIWGSFTTALLSVVGWSLGALIAFYLSKTYGRPFALKFISEEYINRIDKKIPESHNQLISIILLRMVVPVDILSYTLGLFPRISWKNYTIGSILGVIPFSFVFAYIGGLSVKAQVLGLFIILPILMFVWTRRKNYSSLL